MHYSTKLDSFTALHKVQEPLPLTTPWHDVMCCLQGMPQLDLANSCSIFTTSELQSPMQRFVSKGHQLLSKMDPIIRKVTNFLCWPSTYHNRPFSRLGLAMRKIKFLKDSI